MSLLLSLSRFCNFSSFCCSLWTCEFWMELRDNLKNNPCIILMFLGSLNTYVCKTFWEINTALPLKSKYSYSHHGVRSFWLDRFVNYNLILSVIMRKTKFGRYGQRSLMSDTYYFKAWKKSHPDHLVKPTSVEK